MAYREFHNEKYYEAPDVRLLQSGTGITSAISDLFKNIRTERDARRKSADQFKYDLDQGAFENDTKILGEFAKNVTNKMVGAIRKGDANEENEVKKEMKDGLTYQQMSKNQLERSKQLRQNIVDRATKDPYYNPDADLNLIQDATHGKDNDVNLFTRGERLSEAEKKVGGIQSFKFNNYRSDYVKKIGSQSKSVETGNDLSKNSIFNEATFWDKKTGKPGVTDDHAIDFLKSDDRVSEYYTSRIDADLSDEIKKMKASGDSRVGWMKGMSEQDIKTELINDPSKNILDNTEFGQRIREKAKNDLQEADRINSKVSYETKKDDNNSGGRWTNKNVLHDHSVNSFAQTARTIEDGKQSTITTYGPGGRFTQKNGRAIQLDTNNPIRTDISRGITTRDNIGNLKVNMTGYQLMPVKKGFGPFALRSNDPNEMIKEIENLPNDYFDPNGKIGLQPELKVGLSGYTLNESSVLNDINDKMLSIADQIRIASESHDLQALSSLKNTEDNLTEIKAMIAGGDYSENDMLYAANKAGIKKIKQDWLIPANSSDIANVKNITGGFDLNNRSYWSNEMKAVEEAWRKKYQAAQSSGFKSQESTSSPVTKTKKSAVQLKSSYNIGDKTYTVDQLLKLGYTEDQINEAVKLGNIK